VKNEDSTLSLNTDNTQQQHYRLQLLAQAIEKVESECSQNKLAGIPSTSKTQQHQIPIDSFSMSASSQQHELLMQLLAQQNIGAVMAAAAAAAQLQMQHQQKPEPISPPSTSPASSTAESPIDFSSRRSTDDMNDCSSPSSLSPIPNQQLLSTMLQNLQSTNNFPFLLKNKNGKPTRPFKAYPREPLSLPLGFCTGTTSEQSNILVEAASRTTLNRKRLAQTQERLKQQQQLLSSTHFISSSGAQILQPPKKRHRMIENPISNDGVDMNKDINDELNNSIKDDAYWERRRKNNEAAKRSRDARRVKEDEITIR
jgi:bZIP factor